MQMSESSSMWTQLPYEKLRVLFKLNKRLQEIFHEEAIQFSKHTGLMTWLV
jgi:hypothetical protein